MRPRSAPLGLATALVAALFATSTLAYTYTEGGARPSSVLRPTGPWWGYHSSAAHAAMRHGRDLGHDDAAAPQARPPNCLAPNPASAAYARDREALLRLFEALDGPHWAPATAVNWTSGATVSICCFGGVKCFPDSTVKSIVLVNDRGVSGQLPGALAMLENMIYFFASNTAISGSVPAAFGALKQLTSLSITDSQLSSISDGLYTDLVPLRSIVLSGNNISGTISSAIGNLTESLAELNLRDNQLTGTLPDALWDNVNLKTVKLGGNRLTGSLSPAIQRARSLTFVDFSNNDFQGELPDEVYDCSNLTHLYLYANNFTGTVSDRIGRLRSLVDLELSQNSLSGTLPEALYSLTGLQALYLASNRFHGFLDAKIQQLQQLTELGLGANEFEGRLPESLYDLGNLITLSLFQNRFGGDISPKVSQLVRLRNLDMHGQGGKGLEGGIPSGLFQLTALEHLSLSHNSLEGELSPGVSSLAALRELNVEHNPGIGGNFPAGLANLTQLDRLILNDCAFTGQLPVLPLPQLRSLYVSNNQLSGTLDGVTHAPLIELLSLSGNKFEGGLPKGIGKLRELRYLLVDSPQLGGELVDQLQNCTALTTLSIVSSGLQGGLPEWIGNLTQLQTLILVGNNLVGRLPESLSRLRSLRHLDLGSNPRLHGRLPDMSGLRNLTQLSLRGCAVGGVVPAVLADLPLLDTLCLDSNQLSCRVPWGNHSLPSWSAASSRVHSGVGVCQPHEVSVLDGNAIACDIPARLSDIDDSAEAYQCLPDFPEYAKQGILLMAVTMVAIVLAALCECRRSLRASTRRIARPPRQYKAAMEYLRFAKWAAWTSVALLAVAAAAAALNSQAQSGMECRQEFTVSLFGVRYDVVNAADGGGGGDGGSDALNPLLVAAAPLVGVCVWTVAVGSAPRSRRRKPRIEPTPSASSLTETPLTRPRCALAVGIFAVVILTVAPNVGFVSVTGSTYFAAHTKLVVATAIVFIKAFINAVVVPSASRWLLVYTPAQGTTTVAFLPSFWLSLGLRLLNIIFVPVGSVMLLDGRCLYGAVNPSANGEVSLNITYCYEYNLNREGRRTTCLDHEEYEGVQDVPWRWSPACGGAVLQRYGGIIALSLTLQGTAFLLLRILRELVAAYTRRAVSGRRELGLNPVRHLPCGRFAIARRGWRALMEPWHSSLSTVYSNSMMILTAALTYGISAFPPIALAASAALAFTWFVHAWLLRRELRAAEGAMQGSIAPPAVVEAGASRAAAGRAVAGGSVVAMLISSAFQVLMFGGGAFEGSVASYVAAAMPVAAAACWGFTYLLTWPYDSQRVHAQGVDGKLPLLSDDSSVLSSEASESGQDGLPSMGMPPRSTSEIALLLRENSTDRAFESSRRGLSET